MDARGLLIDLHAHVAPAAALDALNAADAERRVARARHSIAEIVAHMSFWQEWFCDRCEGGGSPPPARAAEGWPAVSAGSWPETHRRFLAGLERAASLAMPLERAIAPAIEFPPLAAYTVQDALEHMAQHNSHHLGQVVILRQLMGLWPPPSGGWTW